MKLFCDKVLSQRLERTEGLSNADFVSSHSKLHPGSAAKWIEVAGTYVLFDGVDSPLTQTFGLGLFDAVTEAAEQGCVLAMMCAAPGSQSQRNAEKNDFRVAYTRTKWKAS